MRKNKKFSKTVNIIKNEIVFDGLVDYYFNIFSKMFEWENLPDTVNINYFTKELFFRGSACFYKKGSSIYSLGYGQGGQKNIYGEDIKGIAMGYGKIFQDTNNYITGVNSGSINCVPLFDTSSKRSSFPFLEQLIMKMADILRTIDKLITYAKKPFIIDVDESNVENVKFLLSDFDSNMPFIIGSEVLEKINGMQVLPLPTELNNIKTLSEQYSNIDNMIRRYLGIYNLENNDKKERLLVDEINSNNSVTDLILVDRLKQREEFCERVNEIFGLNISVKEYKEKENETNNVQGMEKEQQPVS